MHEPVIAALVIHVSNIEEGLAWYQRAFPSAVRERVPNFDFEYLRVGTTHLEVVLADAKVSSGPCGTVVYRRVPDLDGALSHLEGLGALLYRGPLPIENGDAMCQVRDPWGNCIGLMGRHRSAKVTAQG